MQDILNITKINSTLTYRAIRLLLAMQNSRTFIWDLLSLNVQFLWFGLCLCSCGRRLAWYCL